MKKSKTRRKPAPAAMWVCARVTRADAGGALYNAVHIATGREFWGVPSYDRDAIWRRVNLLNANKVPLGRAKPTNAVRALEDIFELYDGQEVDSETHQRVIEILTDAGYLIREPLEKWADDEKG